MNHHTLPAESTSVSLSQTLTGTYKNEPVYAFLLQSEKITVTLTNYGCIVMSILAPDKDGNRRNIVSGFATPEEYLENKYYFGCVIGRYANRIGKGQYTLNGKTVQLSVNNNGNHLHGGFEGWDKKVWRVISAKQLKNEACIVFEYKSKDGEEGYPGNITARVTYVLNSLHQLCIHYEATTDQPTPISLTNHSYFNLSGFEQPLVTGHFLQVYASKITEKNDENLPTGAYVTVNGTAFDFRKFKRIGEQISDLKKDGGYDHNFVLKTTNSEEVKKAAELYETSSRRVLQVFTDQPGIQVYTANFWEGDVTGEHNTPYVKHGAVALETQSFPDSPNHERFPGCIIKPGEKYSTTTIYQFGVQP